MPKLPFKKSSKNVNFAVVEIASSFVKAIVFEYVLTDPNPSEPKPDVMEFKPFFNIVGVSNVTLDPGNVRAGLIIDKENVALSVKSAVLNAAKEIDNFSGQLIFSINGELSVGNITTVKVTHSKKDPIKKKDIDQIYKTVAQTSLENVKTEFMRTTGNVNIPMELVITNDVYYKIDGAVVDSLLDEHASQIEAAVYSSYTPSFNISLYENVCKKAGFKLIGISPQLFSISLILKKLKGHFFDGILINIGSDFTEVGVVFGGCLVASKSMSLGGDHFTKVIAEKTNVSLREANVKKQKYLKGDLSDDENLLIQGITSDILELWLDGVQILFESFEGIKTFSSKIYLTGSDIEMPGMFDMLAKEPWTKAIPFKSPPEFFKVLFEDFNHIEDLTGKVIGSDLVPILSAVEVYQFLSEQK